MPERQRQNHIIGLKGLSYYNTSINDKCYPVETKRRNSSVIFLFFPSHPRPHSFLAYFYFLRNA